MPCPGNAKLMRISLQLRYPHRVSSVHAGCKDFRHSGTLRVTRPELAVLANTPEKMEIEHASETRLHMRRSILNQSFVPSWLSIKVYTVNRVTHRTSQNHIETGEAKHN